MVFNFICIIKKQSFDYIQIKNGFLHIRHKEETILEMYKILKPNGQLVIIDYTLNHPFMKELEECNIPIYEESLCFNPKNRQESIKNIFKESEEPIIINNLQYSIYRKN